MRPQGPALAILLLLTASPAALARGEARTIDAKAGKIAVETVADGLARPWAIAFLPDGRMLVTEKGGDMRIVSPDGTISDPLTGVPEVFDEDQGGLLDVTLDPDFADNSRLYFTFSEARGAGAGTSVASARLVEGGLEDVSVIFRQEPAIKGGKHFGSRIEFAPDGAMFVVLGERFQFDPAQDLSNHLGTVVRIRPDGAVPQDNPFVGKAGARPEIWSYGHRNMQAAAIHPQTGALWVVDHGPKGGDELVAPEAGRNYGWPVVSWGDNYDDTPIPDPPSRPEFADAAFQWTPVIAPSGATFYTGDRFADWRGDLLIGGLKVKALVVMDMAGSQPREAERLDLDARIRDVAQGPDGAVYLVTDEKDGKILRLTPAGDQASATAGR